MKNYYIIPLNVLSSFFNFDAKGNIHNDYSIIDMKLLIFLSEYRDIKEPIEFRYVDIMKAIGVKHVPSLNKSLNKFNFYKDKNTGKYYVKLGDSWRVDKIYQNNVYKTHNNLKNKQNVNRYARLPVGIYEYLFSNRDINLWKLTLFILYKTHSDPNINFKIKLPHLYDRLNIPYPKKQNKKLYQLKFNKYLIKLKDLNLIEEGIIINDELHFFKNTNGNNVYK